MIEVEGFIDPKLFKTMSDYVKELFKVHETVLQKSIVNQRDKDEEHFNDTNGNSNLKIGDYVLVKPASSRFDAYGENKLEPLWKGPFRIIGREEQSSIFKIFNPIDGVYDHVHVSRRKLYNHANPEKIQKELFQKANIYIIEKNLDDKRNCKYPSQLSFFIKSAGVFDEFYSWEPWKGIKTVAVVHKYILHG